MNAFYKERHFILKWNPQTVVVFAIILYARLGLLITLHIEIGSFNITWIPSCSMENQLKASYSGFIVIYYAIDIFMLIVSWLLLFFGILKV